MGVSKQQNNWRYRCPNEHAGWETRSDGSYYCRWCDGNGDNPKFTELRDMKREPLRY